MRSLHGDDFSLRSVGSFLEIMLRQWIFLLIIIKEGMGTRNDSLR